MKKQIYLALALLPLVWSCSESNPTEGQKTISSHQEAPGNFSQEKTKEVLDHHWQAFIQNDLEAVMADYNEESVLITPDKTFKGLEEIRENFKAAFLKFPKDKTAFKLSKSEVDRDVAYILWQAKTPTFNLTYGTDTFVIREGKIVRQTYAGVVDALAK